MRYIRWGGGVSKRADITSDQITTFDRIYLTETNGYVMGMLIRKKCLVDNNITFPEGVMFEDVLWGNWLYSKIFSYLHIAEVLYLRSFSLESQTGHLTVKKLEDRATAAIWYFDCINKSFISTQTELMEVLKYSFVYYVYLSSVWWMVAEDGLFNYKLIKNNKKLVKQVMPLWFRDSRCKKNIEAPRWKALTLKIIYYFPASAYALHIILRCFYYPLLHFIKDRFR